MRIKRTVTGQYNIMDGNTDVLCQCNTLTEAVCVLEYVNLTPMSALEKSIARQAVFNWDNKQKELQERKRAKRARLKAKEKANKAPDPEEKEIEVPALPEV